jgi:hypothetical protein
METSEAKTLLNTLANGIDPVTGEVLPDTSPYNDPRVIRALFSVLYPAKRNKQSIKKPDEKQQENMAAGRPLNAGLPWTESLKEELARKFNAGERLDLLAKDFNRTKGAIISELAKQGLMERNAQPLGD